MIFLTFCAFCFAFPLSSHPLPSSSLTLLFFLFPSLPFQSFPLPLAFSRFLYPALCLLSSRFPTLFLFFPWLSVSRSLVRISKTSATLLLLILIPRLMLQHSSINAWKVAVPQGRLQNRSLYGYQCHSLGTPAIVTVKYSPNFPKTRIRIIRAPTLLPPGSRPASR